MNSRFTKKLIVITIVAFLFLKIGFSLYTCSHTYASSRYYAPYDFDHDGVKDEFCFKDSGNCPCNGVSSSCYGCWRDLIPPSISNLEVCFNNSCTKLDYNNPTFFFPTATNKNIIIKWNTTENALCVFRWRYDKTGTEQDLSPSNSSVNTLILPGWYNYQKNFEVTLNLSAPIRFIIDCFDKDTLQGPNYPPNVEVDGSCNIMRDINNVETCKYIHTTGNAINE